jgi:hypothetical protein
MTAKTLTLLLALATVACMHVSAQQPSTAATPATASQATTAAAVDPAVMAILKNLEAAGNKFPLILADLDYKVDMRDVGDTESRTGKVYFQDKSANAPGKFRIQFTSLQQGEKGKPVLQNVDYVFDGYWLTVRKESLKQLSRYQVAPLGQPVDAIQLGKGPFPVPFGQKADTMLKFFQPSTRASKTDDPPDTDYLKLVTRKGAEGDVSAVWLEMWVGKTGPLAGLPVKIVALDRSNNLSTAVFTKITTPQTIDKSTFDLPNPPASEKWTVDIQPMKEQKP